MTQGIFSNYEKEVARLLGGFNPTKSRAIQYSKYTHLQQDFSGWAAIQKLSEALWCPGWKRQVGNNWVWRGAGEVSDQNASREVLLERAIVSTDSYQWANQMSTASGVEGRKLHKRRAIDLVYRNGDRHYSFIELKVDSDNPLYASFELLGYGLAYLHARRSGWQGHGDHNVMLSEQIDLIVLAPESWYFYSERGSPRQFPFDLGWLTSQINQGLSALTENRPSMKFAFQSFKYDRLADPVTAAEQAKWAIIEAAPSWRQLGTQS